MTVLDGLTTIEMLSVDDIRCAAYNPPGRTDAKRLRELQSAIEQAGGILYPVMIGSDGELGDGHRRVACAKALGMSHVPAIRHPYLPGHLLYEILNNPSMPHKSSAWAQAVALGYPVDRVPKKARRNILDWIAALGVEDYAEMAMRRSPSMIDTARSAARLLGDTSPETLRTVIIWMDKHDSIRPLIDALRDKLPREALVAALREDRPLRLRRTWE